jgi:hypothetical protein
MQQILKQLELYERHALIELFREGPFGDENRPLFSKERAILINLGLASKIVCKGVTGFAACTELGAQIYHELMEC